MQINKRARRLLSVFVAFMLCSLLSVSYAQSLMNLGSVDFNRLPESTVKSYAEQAKKKGLSLDDAMQQLKLRGVSDSKINDARRRFSKYLQDEASKKTQAAHKAHAAQAQKTSTTKTDNEKDLKETMEFTHEDSLVYGFHIFNKKGLTFEPSLNMAVSDSYVIGIGDNIRVDVYGAADNSYELVVDNSGSVYFPMVGTVNIGGKKLGDAKVAINNSLRRIYSSLGSSTHTSIQVVETQPVSVSVVGEAFMPGTYPVSSTSSLFNVLYLSGGPNSKGSYRDVQLIRGGKIIAHLDIYDFLVNGNGNVNVKLADGDIVLIPTYQKRVSVGGEFKHVGYFEAKEGETVADLIRYAGGFTAHAQTSRLMVYKNGSFRKELIEVASPEQMKLDNGDSLVVKGIVPGIVGNWVSITGGVRAPGMFAFNEGLTLKELIKNAGGFTEGVYMERGLISRRKDDFNLTSISFDIKKVMAGEHDEKLQPFDEVSIWTTEDIQESRTISINGAVNAPGEFEYRDNFTLSDLILYAGGLKDDACLENIEVVRNLDEKDRQTNTMQSGKVIKLTVTRDLTPGEADNSFILQPYDNVSIRRVPSSSIGGSVRLMGAFKAGGEYGIVDKAVRVSDMVKRAGGLTENANVDGAYIYRRIWILPREKEVKIYQSSVREDTVFYLKSNPVHFEMVSLDLRKALDDPGGKYDIKLYNDDEFVVPEMSQTVRVMGHVQNPGSTTWQKGWNARKYVKNAGGFSSRAKARNTFVVYPNGHSKKVSHILCFRKYPPVTPGSEVIVPEKEERVKMGAPAVVSMISGGISSLAVLLAVLLK